MNIKSKYDSIFDRFNAMHEIEGFNKPTIPDIIAYMLKRNMPVSQDEVNEYVLSCVKNYEDNINNRWELILEPKIKLVNVKKAKLNN